MQRQPITQSIVVQSILSFTKYNTPRQLMECSLPWLQEKMGFSTVCFLEYQEKKGLYNLILGNSTVSNQHLSAVIEQFSKKTIAYQNDQFFTTALNENSLYVFSLVHKNYLILETKDALDDESRSNLLKIIQLFKGQLLLGTQKEPKETNLGLSDFDPEIMLSIVNDSHNGILISDEEGTLCFANKKSRDWLGIKKIENKQLKVYDYEKFFEGDRIRNWKKHVSELKAVKKLNTTGTLVNYTTGTIVNTDVVLSHIQSNGKGYIVANSKDITQENKMKAKFLREDALQEILLKLASTYINTDLLDIEKVINASLEEIAKFVPADRAYIFKYDFIEKTTSNTYEWCADDISPEIDNLQQVPITAIPEWINAHRKKSSFIVHDVGALPDTGPNGLKGILEPQGIKSLITLPMISGDRLIGFIGFDSVRHKKKYSAREETLLSVYSEILVNIELRQKYELELLNQKARFQKIIGSIDLGLVEVDQNFNILFANASFLRFYKYTTKDLVGKNIFSTILPHKENQKVSKRLASIGRKEVFTEEITTYDSNGAKKVVFASIVKQFNEKEEEETNRYLGAIVDLSPQKKMEQELRKSIHRTKEASKAKETFLANMSHELRTPLNIINGTLTELAKEKVSDDSIFLLQQANAASTHMLNLVNNILDFAKINAGEITLDKKEFKLTESVKKIFEIFKLMAREEGLSYELRLDKGIHEYVTGDYGKLNQILINIISNAIKYTNSGFVKLELKLKKDYNNRQTIGFVISDSGVGMSTTFLEKIFDEFQQDILVNHLQSGTGLGMPISKKLVEVMGGDIQVESVKNKGTTVYFELNFEKRNRSRYEEKNTLKNKILNNKTILVAEDNYMNALILERKLMYIGATVHKVENGEMALAEIKKNHIDLVLMDIQMPKMGGVAATKAIRKEFGEALPILAITANVFKNDIENYKNAGMNDVIIKPFEDRTLYAKLLAYLGDGKRYTDKKKTTGTNRKSNTESYSLAHLKTLSNGDEEFYQQMILIFLDLVKNSTTLLENALENNDRLKIRNAAHKLRVSLNDVMATECLALAEYLDQPNLTDTNHFLEKTNAFITSLKIIAKDIEKTHAVN